MSTFKKLFDVKPMTITFLNGDVIRVCVNVATQAQIVNAMGMEAIRNIHFTHYTSDGILGYVLITHDRLIPRDNIRDIVFSDPEIEDENGNVYEMEEVGLAVWESPEGERIMVTLEDIGNF